MTVRIQLSDKRDQAILLVDITADSVEQAEQQFAAAAGLTGLGGAYESFGVPAVATIPAITQLTRPQAPEPWGQPAVPQYQPPMPAAAAPQAAPGGTPVCQHGPKEFKSGVGAKGPWSFWGCKARSDDPTKCEKEWVR